MIDVFDTTFNFDGSSYKKCQLASKNEFEIRLTNFNDDECNTVMAVLDDFFAR